MTDEIYCSPIGKIYVQTNHKQIKSLWIEGKKVQTGHNEPALVKDLICQLDAYFEDSRYKFDLPVRLEGTDFQQRVWKALTRIPAGRTMSYGQLADRLGSSPRAVGNACRANPVPLIIPCHRVIARNGLGGYDGKTSGQRMNIKRWLLQHEHVIVD